MMPPAVLSIGAAFWDVIGRAAHPVAHGDDLPGTILRKPGGGAVNIARALARQGLRPALLSAVGRDSQGEALIAALEAEGIATGCLYRDAGVPTDAYVVIEDAGRGYRRVVASPKPKAIVELSTIKALVETDHVVIAGGGGGIPVFRTNGHHLKGAAAVIDKDFASELLAEDIGADMFIILTAVEKVAVNYNKPDMRWIDEMTVSEAEQYIAEGQFAKGSMLPKVEAAVRFAKSGPGRVALITLLEKAKDGLAGKTGTRIYA